MPFLRKSSPYYNLESDESQVWQGGWPPLLLPLLAVCPALLPLPLVLALWTVLQRQGWGEHRNRAARVSLPPSQLRCTGGNSGGCRNEPGVELARDCVRWEHAARTACDRYSCQ